MPRPGIFYHTPEGSEIRRKRSHSEFLRSQSRSQSPWTSRYDPRPEMSTGSAAATSFLEPPIQNFAPPLVRWAGDGFDYRRPVMSTDSAGPSNGAPDVIDLTSDDTYNTAQFSYSRRLPPLSFTARRHRHRIREQTDQDHRRYPSVDVGIVDLDATAEQSSAPQMAGNQDQQQNRNPGIRHEDSDDSDVVFVGQREVNTPSVRTGLRSEGARPVNEPRDPPRTQTGIGGLGELIREGTRGFFRHTIPYGVFTDLSSFQPPRSLGPPRGMTGRDVFFRALDVARRGGQDRVNQAEWQEDQLRGVHRGGTSSAGPQTFPAQLNFEIQGFELNQDFDDDVTFQGAATRNRANSPPYKAPSAPPEGFTRKLEEELIVVCPNCNEELGRREYDDLKKQVWVVKACGHVYCGECAKNRFTTKTKTGAYSTNRTPTFKRCVVEACEKPVASKTAMLQIYL